MRSGPLGPVAGLAALLGCAGAPEVEPGWETAVARQASAMSGDFVGAAAILQGIDEPGESTHFAAGDRLLYGLEFRDGEVVRRWTMLLEVIDPEVRENGEPRVYLGIVRMPLADGTDSMHPFLSEILRLEATRFDERGAPVAASTINVPREFLVHGLAAGCAAFHGWAPGRQVATPDEAKVMLHTVGACRALFEVIQQDTMLSAVLWQIARAPSMWSVVTNGGVDVSIEVRPEKATLIDGAVDSEGACFRLPLLIAANDQPALLVVADVVHPRSPCNLAAGVVALSAQRPGEPDTHLHVRLLAARRASD